MTALTGPGRLFLPTVPAAAQPDRWSGYLFRLPLTASTQLIYCYAVTTTWRPAPPWPSSEPPLLTRLARLHNYLQRLLEQMARHMMSPRRGDKPDSSYGADGGATRRRFTTSSRRPVIRCTSPERAAGSGSSVRRVVVPGPMVTSQSSNSARRTGPAWPVKVISYVRGCTRITPRSQQHHVRSACQGPGPPSSPVDG